MKGKYDVRGHCQLLTFMLEQVKDVKQKVEVILNLLNSLFETSKSSVQGFLNRDTWLITYNQLQSLMSHLESPQIKDSLRALLQKESKVAAATEDVDADSDEEEFNSQQDIEKSILPSLANFLEKLDNELLKAYQQTSHTKIEYLQRVRDENKFLFLCDSIQKYT